MVKKMKDRRSNSSNIRGRRHTILGRNRRSSIIRPGSEDAGLSLALLKEDANSGDHFLTAAQLSIVYRTNTSTGLSESFARDLLEINGPNTLKEFTPPDNFKIFCQNVFGWMQCFLWAAALLTFCAYIIAEFLDPATRIHNTPEEYLYIGSVIALTVLAMGLFSFYKEAKNAMVMSGFDKMVPPNTFVLRDGEWRWIRTAFVVVGDIVEMSAGQLVPADVRILQCKNFTTDMSALTGESVPVLHVVQCTDVNRLDSRNMCFFSCPVLEGSARGIVVATGENTQVGKIAGLVTGLEKHQTPLVKEINLYIKLACGVVFLFSFVFFIITFSLQDDFILSFAYMLGIILANVPEGLIITMTVCMTLATHRLKKKNCLAKTPHIVETLGCTSVICANKTGTLTLNQVTVSHFLANYEILDRHDIRVAAALNKTYSKLTLVASLNLRAVFDDNHEKITMRKVSGDPSEAAILRYMEAYRSATKTQRENQKVAEIPYNAENKYHVTIHELAETNSYILIMKGAPEIILEYCTRIETDSPEPDVMTLQTNRQLRAAFAKLMNMGERLIAYASSSLTLDQFPIGFEFNSWEPNFPIDNLDFVGAISLMDPPRDGIDKYIGLCRSAGIKVTMVTGDHPLTALAISQQCGTITLPTAYDYAMENHIEVVDVPQHIKKLLKAAVITGEELRKLSPHELKAVLLYYEEITFARTSPQQKLFIVEIYQALDNIVAATGDGVNDAPAVKRADIGIAMGINGTEVCKQAADMIMLNDSFASIVDAIEDGRRIFDNVKKTIAYTLTSNTPEMLPFVLSACLGIPLPMSLMMVILINVGTDLLPAMSLVFETSEEDVMSRPPRRIDDRLVSKVLLFMAFFQIGLIEFSAGMFAYFVTFSQNGFFPGSLIFVQSWDDDGAVVYDTLGRSWRYNERKQIERLAQTNYFVAVCWTQISNLFICRTKRMSIWKKGMSNSVLNVSIGVSVGLVLIVTYVPYCNDFFGTEPIAVANFFLAVPFMLFMIGTDEVRKYLIRNKISEWVEKETCY